MRRSFAGKAVALTYHNAQDKLEYALQARPKPEELVKEGILKGEYTADALISY